MRPPALADLPKEAGRLRVLLADAHTAGGGQVRYILNLTGGLLARGHAVHVACRGGSLLAQEAADLGASVHAVFQFRRGLRPAALVQDLAHAAGLLRREGIQVAHVNGSQDHWLFAIAARRERVPLVRSRHNTNRVRASWPNRWLNRRWTGPQICVCAYTQQLLSGANAVVPPERLHVIHNGVDPALYAPDKRRRAAIRDELGYAQDEVVFGTAARLSRDKGHRFILEALASIREQVPQARALFLGAGPLREALEQQTADLGLGAAVRFAGFQNDMARWVHAFDVGVQPSVDVDTSSFSVKEQMACGIPVIVSDYGGLPEIVAPGAEGFVCPAGEARPLAEAMRQLALDVALRRGMGEEGRARVLREFTLDAFTGSTLAVYQQALAGETRLA